MNNVVVVPAWKEVEIDVTADHPGPTPDCGRTKPD
jgi:hypothetical protein